MHRIGVRPQLGSDPNRSNRYGIRMIAKSIEVEAKTTKEAIDMALNRLHVTKDMVDIKVLSEEHKGLFGMEGHKLAKVKVTLKEVDV